MKIYQGPILAAAIVAISFNSYAGPFDKRTEAMPFTSNAPKNYVHRHMRFDSHPLSGYLNKRLMLGERVAGIDPMEGDELYESHLHRYDELLDSKVTPSTFDSMSSYEWVQMRLKNR